MGMMMVTQAVVWAETIETWGSELPSEVEGHMEGRWRAGRQMASDVVCGCGKRRPYCGKRWRTETGCAGTFSAIGYCSFCALSGPASCPASCSTNHCRQVS